VEVSEDRARSYEIKGDPGRYTREELTEAFVEFKAVIYKLKEMVEHETKELADSDRGRVKLSRAVALAIDIVDSKSWVVLEDDAKEDAKEERKARLSAVNEIAEYMGMVHETSDPMVDRFGIQGWTLINWAWTMRKVFESTEKSFAVLSKERDSYVKEIVGLKGKVVNMSAQTEMSAMSNNEIMEELLREKQEKDKLYQETKRLRDAKNEIAKAEARAARAEREIETSAKAANDAMQDVREELARIRAANVSLAESHKAEVKRLTEELASNVNLRIEDSDKAGRKITRLEETAKKLRDDVAFYEDLCTRNGVAFGDKKQIAADAKVQEEGRQEEAKEG